MEESPALVEIKLTGKVPFHKVDDFSQALVDLAFKYEAKDAQLEQSELQF